MQCGNQWRVQLKQRLAAGQHGELVVMRCGGVVPLLEHRVSQTLGRGKLAASRSVYPDEICIAKIAYGGGAILFPSGPQVAARETQKHRRPAGVESFPLEREVDLFDCISDVPPLVSFHHITSAPA